MSYPLLNRRKMLVASTGLITFAALAQAPLRILCGAPPGSVPDTIARRYAEWLGSRRSGGAIVENRPGRRGSLPSRRLDRPQLMGKHCYLRPAQSRRHTRRCTANSLTTPTPTFAPCQRLPRPIWHWRWDLWFRRRCEAYLR